MQWAVGHSGFKERFGFSSCMPQPLTQSTQQVWLWLGASFTGAMSVPKVMKIELGFQCLLWHITCLLPSPSAPEVEAVSTECSPFPYDSLSDPMFKVKHTRAGKDNLFHFPAAVTLCPQGSKMCTLWTVWVKEILLWLIFTSCFHDLLRSFRFHLAQLWGRCLMQSHCSIDHWNSPPPPGTFR